MQPIYNFKSSEAESFQKYNSFKEIQDKVDNNEDIFICLGNGSHKVKKKAEQSACEMALNYLSTKN